MMLTLQQVALGYGRLNILRDVAFAVNEGEMVGIIGPNGSGKSTLLKGICRVITPNEGRILFKGRDMGSLNRSEIARGIAVVPQTPHLPETFTAFEIVLMGRTPHLGRFRFEGYRDFDIAWRAMEITRTQPLAERTVDKLSGGQKQLLTIARAIAQEPRLMLLDEPTAHLDINYQMEILDFIRALCRDRTLTALAVLHDLNLAAQYCDRLVLLGSGGVRAVGSPREVLTEENIAQTYGARVHIAPHPLNGLPTVLISSHTARAPEPSIRHPR